MLLDNYSIGLLLFAVSMVATPGPANMILLNAGSQFGFKKAIPFVFGIIFFFNIRAVSVGEEVQISITCKDDEKTQVPYKLNLTDVKVNFPDGHTNKIMLTKDTGVIMKYPSFSRFVDAQFSQKEIDENNVLDIIAESIDQIFQGEEVFDESTTSSKEFKEFVESLTNAQMEKLQKFFETSPKLEHKFKVTNPKNKC